MSTPRIPIPEDWTPEQAFAVIDFLSDIHQTIWEAYESEIVEVLLRKEQSPKPDSPEQYPEGECPP